MRRFLALAALSILSWALATPSAAQTVVLFDEGHGQRFLAERSGELDLSNFAAALQRAGGNVRVSRGRIDAAALRGVSSLVVSGAFAPFAPAEIETIRQFVAGGGRLALMLHIGPTVQGLLEMLGLGYSRGTLHESDGVIGGRSGDFAVTHFEPHELTAGLERLSVFGCWALRPGGTSTARVIARTGPRAWLDTNRDGVLSPEDLVGAAAVAVAGDLGAGSYVVFGDDAIFQNRFIREHNGEIGQRLARWLADRRQPARQKKPAGVTEL